MVYTEKLTFVAKLVNARKKEFTVQITGPRNSWSKVLPSKNGRCDLLVDEDWKIRLSFNKNVKRFSATNPDQTFLYGMVIPGESFTVYTVRDGSVPSIRMYPTGITPLDHFSRLITSSRLIRDQFTVTAELLQPRMNPSELPYMITYNGHTQAVINEGQGMKITSDIGIHIDDRIYLKDYSSGEQVSISMNLPRATPYIEWVVSELINGAYVIRNQYDAVLDQECINQNMTEFWGRVHIDADGCGLYQLRNHLTTIEPDTIWMNCNKPGRYIVLAKYLMDDNFELKRSKIRKLLDKIERFERVVQNGGKEMRSGRVVSDRSENPSLEQPKKKGDIDNA